MIQTEVLRQTLNTKIKNALDFEIDYTSNSEEIKTQFAKAISDAIADGVDAWIKTAVVTIQPGIAVVTNTGTGSTTSLGTGSIS
jgi:hypothetical protein